MDDNIGFTFNMDMPSESDSEEEEELDKKSFLKKKIQI